MGGIFEINKTFNGRSYHFWPQTFSSKVKAQKFAGELRRKGYLVRLVSHYGMWQPFTLPAQRSIDR